MRKGKFGNSEHLQNVAAEDAFNHIEVDFGKVLALRLL